MGSRLGAGCRKGELRQLPGVTQVVPPALHGGVDQTDDRVVGEGDDGHFVENHPVQLLIQGVARGPVHGRGGLIVQSVVRGILPARVVELARGMAEQEQLGALRGERIPAGAREFVAAGAAGVEEHLPFLIAELDVDAEFAAPDLLQCLGDLAVPFGRVVEVGDLGKSAAAGKARLGQQPAGFLGPGGQLVRGLVATHAGLTEREGRKLAAAEDALGQLAAIDRGREGAPHPGVTQHGMLSVDVEIVQAKARRDVKLGG